MQDESWDNRSPVENNTAQTLSSEDIEVMKREGASGDPIVEALIANSSTFGNKTVFSQKAGIVNKEFPELAQTGLTYLTWSSDCKICAKGRNRQQGVS
ncbi:tRNA (adenine-N(1)-)-methyltransferase non-catalytic subunit TRM6 [Hordeum vulgare]|nr:tRNA (adenine-N(1)-)-methyltransferase non-catalytic subunit TRM6 [Hordeum vulgare]